MNAFLKVAGWLCATAIIVLSLLPRKPHSGLHNGQLEHVIAYMGTTVLLSLSYRGLTERRAIVIVLVLAAILLEAGQLMLPGRQAQLVDLAAGVAGTCMGAIGAALFDRLWSRVQTGSA